MTAHDLINFELRIRRLFKEGKLPYLIHLCGGNEMQLIRLFAEIRRGDWVFPPTGPITTTSSTAVTPTLWSR